MFNEEILKAAQKRLSKENSKIDLNNPIMIVYKISNKCNLCCEYCYFKVKDVYRKLTVEKFIEFIDYIAQAKNGYIYIAFHGGEPFLEVASMYKIVDEVYRKKYARRVRFSVQTNGTIPDKSFFLYCREKHITIGISIDGNNKVTNACRVANINSNYYFNRINQTFDFLSANLIDFSVISVLTRKNHGKIDEFMDYLIKNDVKSWSCNELITNDDIKDRSIILTASEKLEVYKTIIDKLIEHNSTVNVYNRIYELNIQSWVRAFYKDFFYIFDLCAKNPCGMFDNTLSIDYDGAIFPCDMVSSCNYEICNVYDKNYSDSFHHFEKHKDQLDHLCKCEKCQDCRAKSICKRNCKAVMLSDVKIKNDLCDFYIPLYDYLVTILKDKSVIELLSPSINVHNL